MSLWDDITNADNWREFPGRTGTQAAVCAATFGAVCVASELAERAGETAEELRQTAQNAREGILGEGGVIERASRAAEAPLLRIENVMMWGAIGLIAILAMIAIGALVYFTWPIVWPLIVGR